MEIGKDSKTKRVLFPSFSSQFASKDGEAAPQEEESRRGMGCSSPRGFAGGDSGEWTSRRGDRASSWRSSSPAQVQASMAHVQPSGCFLQVCRDCGSHLRGPFLCGDRSSQFHKGACAFMAVLGDRSAGKAGPAARGKATPFPCHVDMKTLPRSALCLQAVSMDPEGVGIK